MILLVFIEVMIFTKHLLMNVYPVLKKKREKRRKVWKENSPLST